MEEAVVCGTAHGSTLFSYSSFVKNGSLITPSFLAGIQQENRHIRQLQHENKELRAALEESQNAIELIMCKYRQHINYLVSTTKIDKNLINRQRARVITFSLISKKDWVIPPKGICRVTGLVFPLLTRPTHRMFTVVDFSRSSKGSRLRRVNDLQIARSVFHNCYLNSFIVAGFSFAM